MRITLVTGAISVDTERRTLTGTLYRYGEVGQTSAGPLGVSPRMPAPPVGLPVTLEHDRQIVRAHIALVDNTDERLRIGVRVVDGELGDAALAEAQNRLRAAFSLDIEDADVLDGLIISGRWEAVGQVEHPAFNSARIDRIAASTTTPGESMTEEQRARLRELAGRNQRSAEEESEFQALQAQAVAEATAEQPAEQAPEAPAEQAPESTAVAASQPAPRAAVRASVPGGAPSPREATRTEERTGGAFAAFVDQFTRAMRPGNPTRLADVTAALADITHSAHSSVIEAPAWSGELWSGLVYEPQWSDLFNSGDLTNWEGKGWRFTSKLEIQDYAGDKAEIPTDNVTTEASEYEAARMAVGVDIDRKFFDFPNSGFVSSLFEQVRESWTIKLDAKIRAYALANAVAARTDERLPVDVANPVIAAQDSLLKAVAIAVRSLKRRRVGKATWVYVNDDDYFTLFSITNLDVPAYLSLLGVEPENIRSSEDIPQGTVLAGVRQAATVRTLPGSPIRVEAQNLTRAGIDEAFFGYWAIEEHHTSGIAKATFTPA